MQSKRERVGGGFPIGMPYTTLYILCALCMYGCTWLSDFFRWFVKDTKK